jgi:hypothetical protein
MSAERSERSLFGRRQGRRASLGVAEPQQVLLEQLFTEEKQAVGKGADGAAGAQGAKKAGKAKAVLVLDARRGQNLLIAVAQFKSMAEAFIAEEIKLQEAAEVGKEVVTKEALESFYEEHSANQQAFAKNVAGIEDILRLNTTQEIVDQCQNLFGAKPVVVVKGEQGQDEESKEGEGGDGSSDEYEDEVVQAPRNAREALLAAISDRGQPSTSPKGAGKKKRRGRKKISAKEKRDLEKGKGVDRMEATAKAIAAAVMAADIGGGGDKKQQLDEVRAQPKYLVYVKMMAKMQMPEGAIRQKMAVDGMAATDVAAFFGEKPAGEGEGGVLNNKLQTLAECLPTAEEMKKVHVCARTYVCLT